MTSFTPGGIAYDRGGPRGELPIVLIHAGVADRGMWDPIWPELIGDRDVVRLDLRGFGDSAARPAGAVSHPGDVLDVLSGMGVDRCHLVGASFGAGVAVEVALAGPSAVASLLLAAPGGSLLAEMTPDLQAFLDAEGTAVERGDLDAAVEANLSWWVEGTRRSADQVDPSVRERVRRMQRRAFEVTADWDDVEELELDPPALDRLSEIEVPVLVLVGELDLDTVDDAAGRVVAGIAGARRVDWPDAGHLPSLENPAAFAELLLEWVDGTVRALLVRPALTSPAARGHVRGAQFHHLVPRLRHLQDRPERLAAVPVALRRRGNVAPSPYRGGHPGTSRRRITQAILR